MNGHATGRGGSPTISYERFGAGGVTPVVPDCTSSAIAWGPRTFSGEDIATDPPSPAVQLCRSVEIDGTTICAENTEDGKLLFAFIDADQGEINYGEIGGVTMLVGLDPDDPLEGEVVWSSTEDPTGETWLSLAFRSNQVSGQFNNPNPIGPFYLKVTASPGSVPLAGIRDWIGQITVV